MIFPVVCQGLCSKSQVEWGKSDSHIWLEVAYGDHWVEIWDLSSRVILSLLDKYLLTRMVWWKKSWKARAQPLSIRADRGRWGAVARRFGLLQLEKLGGE